VPAPDDIVHDFVVANVSAFENELPAFEKRIWLTALSASVAESVSVTLLLFVAAASPLITTVPVGGVVSAAKAA
jgi:hypothetical protein